MYCPTFGWIAFSLWCGAPNMDEKVSKKLSIKQLLYNLSIVMHNFAFRYILKHLELSTVVMNPVHCRSSEFRNQRIDVKKFLELNNKQGQTSKIFCNLRVLILYMLPLHFVWLSQERTPKIDINLLGRRNENLWICTQFIFYIKFGPWEKRGLITPTSCTWSVLHDRTISRRKWYLIEKY